VKSSKLVASYVIAYPAEIFVFSRPKGDQASPMRGEVFQLPSSRSQSPRSPSSRSTFGRKRQLSWTYAAVSKLVWPSRPLPVYMTRRISDWALYHSKPVRSMS
jgi:hypothetical protein